MAKAVKSIQQPQTEQAANPVDTSEPTKMEEVKKEEIKAATPEVKPVVTEQSKPVQASEPKKVTEDDLGKFITSAVGTTVNLAPFIKSLFPFMGNHPQQVYLLQHESKSIKGMVERWVASGKVNLTSESYKQLGKFYYKGEQQQQCHYNLNDVEIIHKKG